MPFIPHTEADIRDMLAAIGARDTEALFEEIPAKFRVRGLDGAPSALSEMEVGRLMMDLAARDTRRLNFIGAGAYDHHIPSAVWAIVSRGEFYSAYTPYQAEASREGTLQLLYEYQTMMASLAADGRVGVLEALEIAERGGFERVDLRPGADERLDGVRLAVIEREQHRRQALLVVRGGERRLGRQQLAQRRRVPGFDRLEHRHLRSVAMLRLSPPGSTPRRSTCCAASSARTPPPGSRPRSSPRCPCWCSAATRRSAGSPPPSRSARRR